MLLGICVAMFVYGFVIGSILYDYWITVQEMSTIRFFPLNLSDDFDEEVDTEIDDMQRAK